MTNTNSNSVYSVVSDSEVHSSSLRIRWAKHEFDLLAERAAWWPKAKTLIIADPHFGKAAAFRSAGVPVPAGTTRANLDRLAAMLTATAAKRLIILGDFFHAAHGRADDTLRQIGQWRAAHASLSIVLVRGNHDAHAGDPPPEWNLQCVDEPWVEGDLAFRHVPETTGLSADRAPFVLAGHVHPCAVLRDMDGSTMRAACFHVSPGQMVLPAFGAFTGMHAVRPRTGDRVFAIGGNSIIEVKSRQAR